MTYNFQSLIDAFLEGATEGIVGSRTSPGNLYIRDDQLIHYSTPIMERANEEIIVNLTQYSIQTGRLQKMIKETLLNETYKVARHVPRDFKGSLKDYLVVEEINGGKSK
ncbi:hypothetical protein [Butyrivibrio sp. VCB2001]|uniref:hypothetical protein n=1 Tax=Butyrivibrio sp. VCB2001 TaxID=1280667 RepID=UPI0004786CD5|nr:hypothetical protein [Butyrivibrio sp. VCB2001]